MEKKDLSKVKTCPFCGSNDVVYNKSEDELVCKGCREIITKTS
jgi:ribosomal protein S27E